MSSNFWTKFGLLVVGLLVTVASLPTQAAIKEADCPTVDLTTEFDFGPVRSQRQLGWCYAYASSDLVSYRVGRTVSPFDISLSVYRGRPDVQAGKAFKISSFSGANARETLEAIQKYGVCDGTKFSAEGDLAARALPQVETLILEIYNEFASGRPNEEAILARLRASDAILKPIFPSSTAEDLFSALALMKNDPHPLFTLIDTVCGERFVIPDLKFGWDSSPNKIEAMRAHIAEKRPLYIAYSEKSIDNLDYVGRFGHASSVVGMRFDQASQKCEFKIRNSYGAQWPQKANKRLEGKYADGYIWIDEANMARIVGLVAWIE